MCWGISGATKIKAHNHMGYRLYNGDGGFEPASRGPDTNLSTCVVY